MLNFQELSYDFHKLFDEFCRCSHPSWEIFRDKYWVENGFQFIQCCCPRNEERPFFMEMLYREALSYLNSPFVSSLKNANLAVLFILYSLYFGSKGKFPIKITPNDFSNLVDFAKYCDNNQIQNMWHELIEKNAFVLVSANVQKHCNSNRDTSVDRRSVSSTTQSSKSLNELLCKIFPNPDEVDEIHLPSLANYDFESFIEEYQREAATAHLNYLQEKSLYMTGECIEQKTPFLKENLNLVRNEYVDKHYLASFISEGKEEADKDSSRKRELMSLYSGSKSNTPLASSEHSLSPSSSQHCFSYFEDMPQV